MAGIRRRAQAGRTLGTAVGVLLLVATALLLTPSAARGALQWQAAQLKATVEVSGESGRCAWGYGVEQVDLDGQVRNVRIHSPERGDDLPSSGGFKFEVYNVAVVGGKDPGELAVAVGVAGKPQNAEVCVGRRKVEWEAKVDVEATYERAVLIRDSPPPAAPPPVVRPLRCANHTAIIRDRTTQLLDVRALRTSCLQAHALARRYLRSGPSAGARVLAPFTCFDRARLARHTVSCRAAARRYVWFSFSLPSRRCERARPVRCP